MGSTVTAMIFPSLLLTGLAALARAAPYSGEAAAGPPARLQAELGGAPRCRPELHTVWTTEYRQESQQECETVYQAECREQLQRLCHNTTRYTLVTHDKPVVKVCGQLWSCRRVALLILFEGRSAGT